MMRRSIGWRGGLLWVICFPFRDRWVRVDSCRWVLYRLRVGLLFVWSWSFSRRIYFGVWLRLRRWLRSLCRGVLRGSNGVIPFPLQELIVMFDAIIRVPWCLIRSAWRIVRRSWVSRRDLCWTLPVVSFSRVQHWVSTWIPSCARSVFIPAELFNAACWNSHSISPRLILAVVTFLVTRIDDHWIAVLFSGVNRARVSNSLHCNCTEDGWQRLC